MKKKSLTVVLSVVLCLVAITLIVFMQRKKGSVLDEQRVTKVENEQNMEQEQCSSQVTTEATNTIEEVSTSEATSAGEDIKTDIISDEDHSTNEEAAGVKKYKISDITKLTKLAIQDSFAHVDVLKSEDDDLNIEIEYKIKMPTQEETDELKDAIGLKVKNAGDTCELSLKELANGNPFWSTFHWGKGHKSVYVNIKVYVPENFTDVTVETEIGSITASDMRGKLSIESQTGHVEVSNTEANLCVTTQLGYIDFNNVKFVGDCIISSNDGYITSKFGETSKSIANISMESKTGCIDCTFTKKLSNECNFTLTADTGSVAINLEGDNSVTYTTKKEKKIDCKIDALCKMEATSQTGFVSVN